MKTPSKILIVSLFGAALSLSAFAGPGFQYWQNHGVSAKPAADSIAAKPADTTNGVNCATMLDGTVRVSRETTTPKTVNCTPEMMKTSQRCQQACGGS